MNKLKKRLKDIPEDNRAMAKSIFNELLFMQETMEELKQHTKDKGAVTLFKQGKQEFLRENPALKTYNAMVQRYSQLYKQLSELLPVETTQQDELLEFINE